MTSTPHRRSTPHRPSIQLRPSPKPVVFDLDSDPAPEFDSLAELVLMLWPSEPVPTVLDRVENLAPLLHVLDPASATALDVLTALGRDAATLAYLDQYGLLGGPHRDRYLHLVATITALPR